MSLKKIVKVGANVNLGSREVPFLIAADSKGSVYMDAKWTLNVERVYADGVLLEPKPTFEFYDDLNLKKVDISHGNYIFNVNYLDFVFGELQKGGEYDLYRYNIPDETKSLVVLYGFSYSSGEKDEQLFQLDVKFER
ncbi:hypothetical protein [Microbulbifer sp. THAF38]|uniref:hypothetical protein n=1 Tax=Microbulbifer sp. THAF38 TaxID=2587856 RepID=UPI001267B4DB|nr:hypothetical protein [Microbulbifer sp. THAF38]